MYYLRELLSILKSPAWLANTGLPLLVTLLGLILAYGLVRRQLKSDLDLRTADRNQLAASTLGSALSSALERMNLPNSDRFWAQNRWPDSDRLQQAFLEALLSFGSNELPEASRLLRDIDMVWMASMFGAIHADPRPDTAFHKEALLAGLRPFVAALSQYSRRLREWDGLGAAPDAQSPPDLQHVPRDDLNDWAKARRKEYEARINGRAGLRLVKSSGKRLWENGDST